MAEKDRSCDLCGKKKELTEYWFDNGNAKWSRHWCDSCLKGWRADLLELSGTLEKKLEDLTTPWWRRLIKKLGFG